MAVEDSLDRLASALGKLAESLDSAVNALLEAAAAAKSGPKPKVGKAASAPPEASLEAAEPVIPYEQVQRQILAFSEVRGAPATFKLLGELGVKSGKELKPEQYAEALRRFKQELATGLA